MGSDGHGVGVGGDAAPTLAGNQIRGNKDCHSIRIRVEPDGKDVPLALPIAPWC